MNPVSGDIVKIASPTSLPECSIPTGTLSPVDTTIAYDKQLKKVYGISYLFSINPFERLNAGVGRKLATNC